MTDKKKPGPKKKPETVKVQCICSNVHLGGGVVLRAERHPKSGAYVNGDVGECSLADAEIMVENGMVMIK